MRCALWVSVQGKNKARAAPLRRKSGSHTTLPAEDPEPHAQQKAVDSVLESVRPCVGLPSISQRSNVA